MKPVLSENVAILAIVLSLTLGGAFSAAQTPAQFNADSPMEVAASQAAVDRLLAEHTEEDYLLFPEDRRRPIRMTDALPHCWTESGPGETFQA